jgi:hypothetical protein
MLVMRLSYQTGAMTWMVADDVLSTTVMGGMGEDLSVDLSAYTIGSLATYLAGQLGYQVLYLHPDYSNLSALALVEETNNIATSNGDHIHVATNPNWAYMSAVGSELSVVRRMIELAPSQMATTTARGEWLDLLGSYYKVPRTLEENDTQYSPRVPAEVILPRQNNVAIEAALQTATGQDVSCVNALVYGSPLPLFDGAIKFDGSHFFNAAAGRIYNLFDITIGYDLIGSSTPDGYLVSIRDQVDRLRAAGTHLRNLTLGPSLLVDRVAPPTDGLDETWTIVGMIGTGTSADIGVAVWQYLAGNGTSADSGSASLTALPNATGAFAGAGGFSAIPTARLQARGAFLGSGSVTVLPSATLLAGGSFSGLASFVGSGIRRPSAISALVGAGSFSGSALLRAMGSATLAGAGGFTAIARGPWPATGVMAGSGAVTGSALVRARATGAVAGTGGFVSSV